MTLKIEELEVGQKVWLGWSLIRTGADPVAKIREVTVVSPEYAIIDSGFGTECIKTYSFMVLYATEEEARAAVADELEAGARRLLEAADATRTGKEVMA